MAEIPGLASHAMIGQLASSSPQGAIINRFNGTARANMVATTRASLKKVLNYVLLTPFLGLSSLFSPAYTSSATCTLEISYAVVKGAEGILTSPPMWLCRSTIVYNAW
jgi:hypothetical protein